MSGTLGWEETPREHSRIHVFLVGPCQACYALCTPCPTSIQPVFSGGCRRREYDKRRGRASRKEAREREREEEKREPEPEPEFGRAGEGEEVKQGPEEEEEESSPAFTSMHSTSPLFLLISYKIIGNVLFS